MEFIILKDINFLLPNNIRMNLHFLQNVLTKKHINYYKSTYVSVICFDIYYENLFWVLNNINIYHTKNKNIKKFFV